eukprot:Opistho-2@49209
MASKHILAACAFLALAAGIVASDALSAQEMFDVLPPLTMNDVPKNITQTYRQGDDSICTACKVTASLLTMLLPFVKNHDEIQPGSLCNKIPNIFYDICRPIVDFKGYVGMLERGGVEITCLEAFAGHCSAVCCSNDQPQQLHLSLHPINGRPDLAASWVTLNPTVTSTVKFGTSSGVYTHTFNGACSTYNDTQAPGGWFGTIHEAYLEGLAPLTTYYYKVGDDVGGWSDEFSVTTPSVDGKADEPIALVADMGVPNSEMTVARLIDEVAKGTVKMVLHAADISYADGRQHLWDHFMQNVQPFAARVPYQVCPGNHERIGDSNLVAYLARFPFPGKAEGRAWFAFDYSFIHFISISTEHATDSSSEQWRWLAEELERSNTEAQRAVTPWLIVYGHRPLYCSNQRPDIDDCNKMAEKFRTDLDELFYKYKVDVYFTGHVHSYERTLPVHNLTAENSYVNPSFPVHVINGAAGNIEMLDVEWYMPKPDWSAVRLSVYGYNKMWANATNMHWQYIQDTDGAVVDEFEIVKTAKTLW